MSKGRPTKPLEQKRMLGNPGKRTLPKEGELIQLDPIREIPEPPRPLGKYGLELWDRVWNMGSTWVSPTTDLELLLMTCEMIDERWNLRATVLRDGDPKQRRQLRYIEQAIVSNLSLLGFSPSDRTRLGVAEVKAKSKLEELMARRNERN
jgi:hypothetical protein